MLRTHSPHSCLPTSHLACSTWIPSDAAKSCSSCGLRWRPCKAGFHFKLTGPSTFLAVSWSFPKKTKAGRKLLHYLKRRNHPESPSSLACSDHWSSSTYPGAKTQRNSEKLLVFIHWKRLVFSSCFFNAWIRIWCWTSCPLASAPQKPPVSEQTNRESIQSAQQHLRWS